jgi:hypothetical protein
MDDASNIPPMGGDPAAMGSDPAAMGGDPAAMGGDPAAMDGDPAAMGGDPAAMGGDETMGIINQLSDKDREAVRAYAKSLLPNSNATSNEDQNMAADANMQAPMNESFIFKKRQLNNIFENFGPTEDELSKDKKNNFIKNSKKPQFNSPFNAPKFK